MGVGDPEHLRRAVGWKRLRERGVPLQGKGHGPLLAAPALKSTRVISEAGLGQQRQTTAGRITGGPSEQFRRAIAREHQLRIQVMQPRDLVAQPPVAAVGISPQIHLPQGPPGRPRQSEGRQGGAGIEDLIRPAAQAPRRRLQVAAMGEVDYRYQLKPRYQRRAWGDDARSPELQRPRRSGRGVAALHGCEWAQYGT